MPDRMLELSEAIAQSSSEQKYHQIHCHAHTIKGIAGNLSALSLQRLAHQLEMASKSHDDDEINSVHKTLITAYQELQTELSSSTC